MKKISIESRCLILLNTDYAKHGFDDAKTFIAAVSRFKSKLTIPKLINKLRVLYYHFMNLFSPHLFIHGIVIIVGQACTLRCMHCGNFSPFAPKSAMVYPIKTLIDDTKMLLSHVRKINSIQIQGGEPFLYKDLCELIHFLHDSEKVNGITIATNGTLLPSQEQINAFKKCGVTVRISNYDVPSGKTEKIIDLLYENNIHHMVYSFISRDNHWIDLGVGMDTDTDEKAVRKRFNECDFRVCLTLENGRLSRCSRGVIAGALQDIPSANDGLLNLRRGVSYPEIKRWLLNRKHMECCKYCNGTSSGAKIEPTLQASKHMQSYSDLVDYYRGNKNA